VSSKEQLTEFAQRFLEPANANQRLYEALRAHYVEGLSATQAAQRFGYAPGSFRVLLHRFRQDPDRPFFLTPAKGPHAAPKTDRAHDRIIALRKQNLSIYDISRALANEDLPLSPVAIANVLRDEGFARLPRRPDEERPTDTRPTSADTADVRQLNLAPRSLRTQFGGLFLFLPTLAQVPFDTLLRQVGFPGSQMIPAGAAVRSLLALKLFGSARHSHVMSAVLDEGLALFAGLNVIPKRSFLTEYSCRIDPACYPKLMRRWFDAVGQLGLSRGSSFNLDFHTIPFHGDDALLEKHYVSKRSRRQKGLLAFLAQDARTRVFCYANGQVRKNNQNDEILRFAEFWKQRTGAWPEELIFDSKLTTYANLNQLNGHGIPFMTLRRRSATLLAACASRPRSAWQRIELDGVSRLYKHPRILDQRITLADYDGSLRQLVIMDLGHEEPTFLLTNQLRRSATRLINRYAQRMLIENTIADGIDFFHMDALSSVVAMKVNCDLQLTLMASSLYRLLAERIGNGYTNAESRHLFRDFIQASAHIIVSKEVIEVRFQKRAHNPFLLAAGFDTTDQVIPWLGKKRLRLVFG
jgi:transposase